jgi:hypothetical protein
MLWKMIFPWKLLVDFKFKFHDKTELEASSSIKTDNKTNL